MMPARCFADKLFCHQPPLFGAGRQRFGIRRTELFVCLFVLFVLFLRSGTWRVITTAILQNSSTAPYAPRFNLV